MKALASHSKGRRWAAIVFARALLGVSPAFAQGNVMTVRLADQPGAEVDYGAVWVAEGLGFYEKEGIRIERKTYANGPAALLDMPSGSVDAVMAAIAPGEFRWLRGGDQPRPLLPRPTRHPHPRLRRRQPGGVVRGEFRGI